MFCLALVWNFVITSANILDQKSLFWGEHFSGFVNELSMKVVSKNVNVLQNKENDINFFNYMSQFEIWHSIYIWSCKPFYLMARNHFFYVIFVSKYNSTVWSNCACDRMSWLISQSNYQFCRIGYRSSDIENQTSISLYLFKSSKI